MRATLHAILDELGQLVDRLDDGQLDSLLNILSGSGRIFMAGAGRSGLMLRAFAMRLMHMGREVHLVGDVTTPAIGPGDILLIGSGSGETGSLVMMARKADDLGAKIALVTSNAASTIAGMADVVVAVPAVSPKVAAGSARSFQPMGNLFEQSLLLILDCAVMHLMRRLDMSSETMFTRHANLE